MSSVIVLISAILGAVIGAVGTVVAAMIGRSGKQQRPVPIVQLREDVLKEADSLLTC